MVCPALILGSGLGSSGSDGEMLVACWGALYNRVCVCVCVLCSLPRARRLHTVVRCLSHACGKERNRAALRPWPANCSLQNQAQFNVGNWCCTLANRLITRVPCTYAQSCEGHSGRRHMRMHAQQYAEAQLAQLALHGTWPGGLELSSSVHAQWALARSITALYSGMVGSLGFLLQRLLLQLGVLTVRLVQLW